MASNDDVSKKVLEDIKQLLKNLSDSHLWKLIDEIRDSCNVIIPVWFTTALVKEITEESLGVTLSDEDAKDVIDNVNSDSMSYSLGRELVESLIEEYLPEQDETELKEKDDDKYERIVTSVLSLINK